MRKPLIAGNWKMNGSKASVTTLLEGVVGGMQDLSNVDVAVCVPFPYLEQSERMLKGSAVALGAQNLCTESGGAFTGEVSASMLLDFGCHVVICGHSERREYYGEDDAIVAAKIAQAVSAGLRPIFCVGETLEQRQQGETDAVIAGQVDGVIERIGIEIFRKVEIAYEPVWAIGTGMTATPEQAQDVHAFIRARIAALDPEIAAGIRILYGGSMKPGNASELLAQPDLDGGLIGGASLDATDFLAICRAGEQSVASAR
ncbi:triose-phosphate isomerase [Thiocapsa imhoffii]|uniref:Triosephosphate isomerase n=1 Tax=Thiocapsa imhoffii TaxID=382777 RepID=A0A9X0WHL8_9GAMM|nr:triose-phosphate isomerase [Thiocapsa imhoffii]MBK1644469.1 triose-phosphate isomerase [Thiocapsa imhoffii]